MLAEYHDYTFRLGHVTDNYENLFYGDKAQQIALIWGTEFIAGCADCAFQSYCGADPVRNHSTQNDMYASAQLLLSVKSIKQLSPTCSL